MFSKSARFYDAIYAFKDYAAEADLVTRYVRGSAPDARTLLDVACGTGLHMEHLRRNFLVEGIDVDPDLLAIARERNPDCSLHEGDMRDFDLGRTFDAVTCLFSSIGYMADVDQLKQAVANMARHLSPGGVLVVEGWFTPEEFEPYHVGAVFVDEPDLKIARVNNGQVDGRLSKFTFHYVVGTPDEVTTFTEDHALALFTREEYEGAFAAAGLEVRVEADGLMGRGNYIGTKPRS